MSYTMKINITKDILEKSKNCGRNHDNISKETGIGSNCAISLGIRDIFKDAWIYSDYIDFTFLVEKTSHIITFKMISIVQNCQKKL